MGNIKQVGYSNDFKYVPVRDKDNLIYKLSFDLGNQNDYQTLSDNFTWSSFSNLSLFWDYTAQRTTLNGGVGALSVYPSDAIIENRVFYMYGIPGAIGYYNQLATDQPLIIYTLTPIDISQSQQVGFLNSLHQNYIFDLIVEDSNKFVLRPPSSIPSDWYEAEISITDSNGSIDQTVFNLQYVPPQ